MYGNGPPATSSRIPASRASRTRSTPRPSSEASTRCCAVAPGPPDPAPFATRSVIGITLSAARFSAASGALAMSETFTQRTSGAVAAYRQPNPRMLAEVAAGLSAPQKELPPKYFYDHRGSELFEEITRLPEYYQTRTERALLEAWMPELIAQLGTRSLIELGAGSAEKSRVILGAMRRSGATGFYVPIDVSASFLTQTAAKLRHDYPGLTVEPIIADITEEFSAPHA